MSFTVSNQTSGTSFSLSVSKWGSTSSSETTTVKTPFTVLFTPVVTGYFTPSRIVDTVIGYNWTLVKGDSKEFITGHFHVESFEEKDKSTAWVCLQNSQLEGHDRLCVIIREANLSKLSRLDASYRAFIVVIDAKNKALQKAHFADMTISDLGAFLTSNKFSLDDFMLVEG